VPGGGIGVSSPPPPDPWPAERATPEHVFAEPEQDDDDTGPVQISTPTPAKVTTPESGPGEDDWSRRFADALTINPRPIRRNRKPIVFFGVVALAAVVVIAALAFWLLRPSPATQDAGSGPATSANPSPSKDADRLLSLLPPGYPPVHVKQRLRRKMHWHRSIATRILIRAARCQRPTGWSGTRLRWTPS